MTDLTKLADALEDIADSNSDLVTLERDSAREAARILRAAGAADVGGLMELADLHGACRWSTGYNESAKHRAAAADADNSAQEARAALESALRVALAPKAGTDGYVIDLLVAAGHVTTEKVAQAREIAAAQAGAQESAKC